MKFSATEFCTDLLLQLTTYSKYIKLLLIITYLSRKRIEISLQWKLLHEPPHLHVESVEISEELVSVLHLRFDPHSEFVIVEVSPDVGNIFYVNTEGLL